MRIGLNGQKLLIEKPAGPEVYTYNLFQALSKIDDFNTYVIYFNREPPKDYFSKLTNNNRNFSYTAIWNKSFWTQLELATELFRNPVDVFFTAVHTFPIIHPKNTRIVVMIHGLEYKFSKKGFLWRLFLAGKHEWYTSRFSDAIIAPSNATKEALLNKNWKGVSEGKISVILEGVNSNYYKRSGSEITHVKKEYGIENDYLIFVSTIQPRKNIPEMVAGFGKALQEISTKGMKLVIAGKKGWSYAESLEVPKKLGIEENVMFLGRVPSEDLPPLLSGAKAFISCSLEEGFGLPLLEAMACEIPCVVSNIPAFKEVGGDYPIYVNPKDAESIKKGILSIFQNPQAVEKIKAAKERASILTWEKTAEKTLSVIQGVFKNG